MSEGRAIKQRRAKVDKRANPSSDFQPMALEPAWNYFITAKIGEGIRDHTKTDYSNTWLYFTACMDEENYAVKYVHEITPEICRNYIHYLTVEGPAVQDRITGRFLQLFQVDH